MDTAKLAEEAWIAFKAKGNFSPLGGYRELPEWQRKCWESAAEAIAAPLTSALAAAKEEIDRQREQERATEKERRYWYDLAGKAESSLASERKGTERLRELLRDAFDPMQHRVACQKRLMDRCMCHECIKERTKAALQPPKEAQ